MNTNTCGITYFNFSFVDFYNQLILIYYFLYHHYKLVLFFYYHRLICLLLDSKQQATATRKGHRIQNIRPTTGAKRILGDNMMSPFDEKSKFYRDLAKQTGFRSKQVRNTVVVVGLIVSGYLLSKVRYSDVGGLRGVNQYGITRRK